MALLAFWQPALLINIEKYCDVDYWANKMLACLLAIVITFFTEANGASKVKVGSATDGQLGRCQ